MLFVSCWHLGLEKHPEGTFTHRRVSAEVAKQMIDTRSRSIHSKPQPHRRADSRAPLAPRRREHKRKPRSQLSLTPRFILSCAGRM